MSFLKILVISSIPSPYEGVVQSYVASMAVSKGFSTNFSFTLVAIMNGSSGLGRMAAGVIARYIGACSFSFLERLPRSPTVLLGIFYITGPMNHMIPSTIITAAIVLAWPAALTSSGLITISTLYGYASDLLLTTFLLSH